jgi:hypothetical protein
VQADQNGSYYANRAGEDAVGKIEGKEHDAPPNWGYYTKSLKV